MRTPLIVALVLLGAACSDDGKISGSEDDSDRGSDAGSGSGDAGDDDAECTADSECGTGRICEGDTCVDGDRNNSVDEAESLLFGDSSDPDSFLDGTINPAGDIDYFAIEADGGEFIRVATYTDEEDETKDTVVSIIQDNGKLVTYANGHAAGGGVSDADSLVYAYLPEEGTYYVVVQDDATWFEEGEESAGRDYTYQLLLTEWLAVTSETDAFDAPSTAIEVTSPYSWSGRGAVLESAGDSDFMALTVELDGYDLFLDGNYDLSGSDADPRLRLLDASTGEVYGDKRQNGLSGRLFFPAMPAGEYIVEVSDADGGGGAAHWLFVHALAVEHEDNYIWESESNDDSGLAEVVVQEELSTDSGNEYTVARIEGLADFDGDEDWFGLSSDYAEGNLVVCLNSSWYGATTAPTIEVYDSAGELLASEAGATDSAVFPTADLTNIPVSTGDYQLRVVHPEGAGGQPGDWYRALVFVASFEVTDYACP